MSRLFRRGLINADFARPLPHIRAELRSHPMSEAQLQLFGDQKPLLERFGHDFFRRAPRAPGVYIMTDSAGRVLYVGQSGNLRDRLGSHKNAGMLRGSRRVRRMLPQVHAITWEPCPSAERARLRENELIRLHRPRFNVVNVYPRAYCYVGIAWDLHCLSVRISRELPSGDDQKWHGAFKSQARVNATLAAMHRLFWVACFDPRRTDSLPPRFLAPVVSNGLDVHYGPLAVRGCVAGWREDLETYFSGESIALKDRFAAVCASGSGRPLFLERIVAADLATVEQFFQFGPARNRALLRRHGLGDGLIGQEELDDLLAIDRRPPTRRSGAAMGSASPGASVDGAGIPERIRAVPG